MKQKPFFVEMLLDLTTPLEAPGRVTYSGDFRATWRGFARGPFDAAEKAESMSSADEECYTTTRVTRLKRRSQSRLEAFRIG